MSHFLWIRGDDGVEGLEARTTFTPLPHRGAITLGRSGAFQSYQLEPGPDAYGTPLVVLDGTEYRVQYDDSARTSSVFTYKGSPDAMTRIGTQVDRVLASRRLDSLFWAEGP